VNQTSLLTEPSIPPPSPVAIVLWGIDLFVRSYTVRWYIVEPRRRCYNGTL
jgi:hypothetical protein